MKIRLLLLFILAFLLTIIPTPQWFFEIRPAAVLLLLFYVQFFLPQYFNLLCIFIAGLLLDIMRATILCEHVFALLLALGLAAHKARRFVFHDPLRQSGVVLLLTLVYEAALATVELIVGNHVSFIVSLGNAIVTMLLWIPVAFAGHRIFDPDVSSD